MVLVLDRKTVLDCLDLRALAGEIGEGMKALTEGRVVQPLRTRVFSAETGGLLASLPCYLAGEELFSAKLGFSHPDLRHPDGTRHITQIIAYGDTEGRLLSLMHGTLLGMYRTAACSAVAARYLAPESASRLAIIGCGPMGRAEAEVMAAVRPLRCITAFDLNRAAAEELRRSVEASTGVEVVICESAEAAVREAEIVSLATTSHEPVIRREWLRDASHVSALGAHRKDHREVDSATIAGAGLFIESREALMAEAGDYLIPLGEGAIGAAHPVFEIGELLTDPDRFSQWRERPTVFKSTGVGIQDLVIARHVYERARAAGRGLELDF